jgi:hypothetical protein
MPLVLLLGVAAEGDRDVDDDGGELLEGVVVDEGEVEVELLREVDVGAAEEGEDVGAAEVGALEGDDEVEELDDGDDEDEEGDELAEEGEDEGVAALKLAVDIKDKGPELNRIAERETTITRDKIRDCLLIVTLVLSLALSSLLSSISLSVTYYPPPIPPGSGQSFLYSDPCHL